MSEALALLSALAPGDPVGFAVHDEELRFLLVTPSLAAVNGQPVEAHLRKTVSELLPGLGAAVEALQRRALAQDRPLGLELRGVTPGSAGTRTWAVHHQPIVHRGRRFLGSTVLDVTERREAQERLEAARSTLAEAERMAALGSLRWDIETAEQWTWSEQVFRLADCGPPPARPAGSPGWPPSRPPTASASGQRCGGRCARPPSSTSPSASGCPAAGSA